MAPLLVAIGLLAFVFLLAPTLGIDLAPIRSVVARFGLSTETIGWLLLLVVGMLMAWSAYLRLEKTAEKRRITSQQDKTSKLAQKRIDRRAELDFEIERLRKDPALDVRAREEAIEQLRAEIDWLLSDDTR